MANKLDIIEALKKARDFANAAVEAGKPSLRKAGDTAVAVAEKGGELSKKAMDEIVAAIDQNGNNAIDVEDIIILGVRSPGVKINRSDFLKKELFKYYPEDVIKKAIASNPAKAGIKSEDIEKIADEVVKAERNIVSGLSAALCMPGGIAMVATIPADLAQYYGAMLRVMQKLLYLYGFPQIDMEEKGSRLDSETVNLLTLCLGVMYGVAGANHALHTVAKMLAQGVEKKLIKAALTKGAIYPIVKKVAQWFAISMTKELFAKTVSKSIPIIGGIIGGGLTFVTFKPCCDRLRESLINTRLSNPGVSDSVEFEEDELGIIDVDIIPKTDDSE